jgi:Molecular chaperone (small heat shock protein)
MTHVKLSRKPFDVNLNNFVDELFTDLPGLWKNDFNKYTRQDWVPVNVKESATNYELEIVAPGFEKSDFKINVDKGLLTISGEKTATEDTGTVPDFKQVRREYSYRSFKRSFTLDEKIDATNIDARYINGVLTLNLPRKEEVKPPVTQIQVK